MQARASLTTPTPRKPSCKECASGKYNPNKASISASSCTNCVAGKYSGISGATTSGQCTDCTAGKASSSPGAISINACNPCVAGKYSNTARTTCLFTILFIRIFTFYSISHNMLLLQKKNREYRSH